MKRCPKDKVIAEFSKFLPANIEEQRALKDEIEDEYYDEEDDGQGSEEGSESENEEAEQEGDEKEEEQKLSPDEIAAQK